MDTLPRCAPEEVGMDGARLRRLRDVTRKYVDSGAKPSSQVLVARCGKLVFEDCYGFSDHDRQQPLRDNAIFRLASMTKPITAVAAMICYERGCFQLEDPLAAYLPEWKHTQVMVGGDADDMQLEPQRTPITIKQLFTHCAGLTPLGVSEAAKAGHRVLRTRKPTDLKSFCEALAASPLSAQPGERWQYGSGLTVLGRCVEVWSGMTLDAFFQDEIFDRLGMVDTGFKLAEAKLHRLHQNFRKTKGGAMEPLPMATKTLTARGGIFNGSGGLVGTAADYLRFAMMLCNEGVGVNGARLLGPRSVRYMALNHLPGGVDIAAIGVESFTETTTAGIGFGFGMAVVLDPATSHVLRNPGEYYWGGAFSTAFYVDPVDQLAVVYMTQLSPSGAYPIRQELRVAVGQAIIADVPRATHNAGRSRL